MEKTNDRPNGLISFILSHREVLLLAGILAVSAFFRLYHIDRYMTFLGDEGRDMLVVKRMIVDGKWTLLGPTASVGGFFMGPIYYYFMLPFLWLFRLNPVGPSVMVALVGVATVYLVWNWARRNFGVWPALIASAMYAVSPIVVSYSRSSWNPNVVPFFSILLITFLDRMAKAKPTPVVAFLVGIILGIGIQLHYLFLFLWVLVAVWWILTPKTRTNPVLYASAIGGVILGFSPFLAFEMRHDFPNIRAIIAFIFAGKETGFTESVFAGNILDIVTRLFGRFVIRLPDVGQLAAMGGSAASGWIFASRLTAAAVIVLTAYDAFLSKNPVAKRIHALASGKLLFLWLAVPLLLFGLYRKSIYDYYFGIIFPVPILMTAWALATVARIRLGKFLAVGLAAIVLFNLWLGRPFQFQANNQLGQARLIAEAAIAETGGKPFNFALITGSNSDFAYRYFFELWNRSPVAIENPASDPARKSVTDQLIVVCEMQPCQPVGNSLWEIAGFGQTDIASIKRVSVVTIYRLVHYRNP